jgi:hypothetical protein
LLPSLSLAAFVVSSGHADENYFGYSYGSETLPKGKWELYSWTTGRFAKGTGSYSAFDLKQEVEYGVTDRFQIALEWKGNHTYFTGGAGQENAGSSTPVRRNRFSFVGNGLELKYAFSSPYKDPWVQRSNRSAALPHRRFLVCPRSTPIIESTRNGSACFGFAR